MPTLAVLATQGVTRDRQAWSDWLSRLTPTGPRGLSGRSALQGYAILLASMIVCLLVVFEFRDFLSPGAYAREPVAFSAGLISAVLISAFLDQGAVLEEAGWRGFATPLLQRHGVSPLRAAVLVGVVWGLWHIPRDVVSGVVDSLGLLEYLFMFLPAFVLNTITTSVVASYFMNRLGGSLIPAIAVHGLANDAMGFSGMVSIDQALTPYHQMTRAIPFLLLAVGIALASGKQLGLQDEACATDADVR